MKMGHTLLCVLSLFYKPRSIITVSPSWLGPGASVTLNCQVKPPSAGWRFYWYKAVPKPSDGSYSYELLPGNSSGTEQGSYMVHGQTHTAGYVCRAGRGDPVFYTDYSDPTFVWSGDSHPAASLTVSPDQGQHFTDDSVSVSCEGNSADWRVMRFTEDVYSSCFYWGRMTGSTCNINTSWSSTAVYWCESGSGEFSNAVNITVHEHQPESSSLLVPLIVRLVCGPLLIFLLLLLLMCCCRTKNNPCWNRFNPSLSINQDSAPQQTVKQDETQVYSSLLHGDDCVYESIRGSGNTGSDS